MAAPLVPLVAVVVAALWDHIVEGIGLVSPRAAAWLSDRTDRWVEGPVRNWTRSQLDDAVTLGLDRGEADRLANQVASVPGLLGLLAAVYVGIKMLGIRISAWTNALAILEQRRVADQTRFTLPDLSGLLRYVELYPERARDVDDFLDQHGLSQEAQRILLESRRLTPDYTAVLTLRNRDIINDREALEYLAQLGYRGADPEAILQLRHWYPSPQDLVTLAGREAFEEDAIERFELDTDIPPGLYEAGEKAGLSKAWMRRFWVAHWQNPSLNQVFQMIHRSARKKDGQPFTLADLDVFYRLADVNPFFGDLLRQIAYNPIGRIDIRRFRERGIISAEETIQRYQALGYSPEDAVVMADFAEHERETYGRDLSRSQIERLYRMGEIDALEMEEDLFLIGYDREEAAQIRLLMDADIQLDRTQEQREAVEYLYLRYQLDDIQAGKELSDLGIKGDRVAELLDEWKARRITGRALPTVTTVIRWVENGIVDRAEGRNLLLLRRIDPVDVDRYIPPADTDPNEDSWADYYLQAVRGGNE